MTGSHYYPQPRGNYPHKAPPHHHNHLFPNSSLITCISSVISLLWTSQSKGSPFPAREPPPFPPPAWVEALFTSRLCCSPVPPLPSPFFPSCRQSVPSRCSQEGARPKSAKPSPTHNAVRTEGGWGLPSADKCSNESKLASQSRTQIPSSSSRGGEADRRISPG